MTRLAVLPRHARLPAPRSLCRHLSMRCSSNSLVLLLLLLLLLVSGKGLILLLLLDQAGPRILQVGALSGQLVLVGSHGLALLLDILLHWGAHRALLIGALLVVLEQVPGGHTPGHATKCQKGVSVISVQHSEDLPKAVLTRTQFKTPRSKRKYSYPDNDPETAQHPGVKDELLFTQ